MDRERLKRYLDGGMSLNQIGALENRDPSTVGYWVKKHGFTANGRAKHAAVGSVSKALLRELVESGATLEQIATRIDRSVSASRHWLSRFGLKTKGRRGPRPMVPHEVVEAALASGERTVQGTCRHHGPSIFVIEPGGRVRCRRCRMERVSKRRRDNKWVLAEEAGGKCIRCGYNRFIGALQFHHRDRAEKKFGISHSGSTMGIDRLREEAKKCDLLCANCHAEVEHGADDLPIK